MLAVLRQKTFRNLFLAQLVALSGTGLATVALALLAFELAGDQAGAVLGTALALKMIAYVTIAPLASAFLPARHRKAALIALDLVRAGVALMLPFVTEIWQIYVLIFLLQSASASFTPVFQAMIPEVLPDERDYTRALSLSRMAYDLESLLSPALAAMLLTIISFHGLFAGTSVGFVGSALLVLITTLPAAQSAARSGKPYQRAMRGMRIYLGTPRLRGLLALNLVAAAGGAMVFVNTVVLVRSGLGGGERQVAWALASFGAGSMAVALILPRILDRVVDRRVLLLAAAAMSFALIVGTGLYAAFDGQWGWSVLLPLWFAMGASYAGLVTPGGRLLRRSSDNAHLPELFAAQFSLSHACWLLAYPLAGWVGARAGLDVAFLALTLVAVISALVARTVWRDADELPVAHAHPELPEDHPHLKEHGLAQNHRHPALIDELHTRWPGRS
jgi:MFS family permease